VLGLLHDYNGFVIKRAFKIYDTINVKIRGYFEHLTKSLKTNARTAKSCRTGQFFHYVAGVGAASCSFIKNENLMSGQKHDIVDTAVAAGSFKTLVAAVQAAGLVQTFKVSGPFTVFAPSDAASAKLPAGTVKMLIKPENKAKLSGILKFHAVAGKVMAAGVAGKKVHPESVHGESLNVDGSDYAYALKSISVIKCDA
jgi:hypothetical protein